MKNKEQKALEQEYLRQLKKEDKQKKRGGFLRYFHFKNLKTEIRGYGYEYSFQKYCFTLLGAFLGIFAISKLLTLQGAYTVVVMASFLFFFPLILLSQFKHMYEEKRFRNAVDYMEQMIYSFKRKGKILDSLRDARLSFTQTMAERIDEAIAYLEKGQAKKNLYREALGIMEADYGCDRMIVLHDFLIKVEEVGGVYDRTLNIILQDIKEWTERTYIFQKERSRMRVRIDLSLLISLLLTGAFPFLLSKEQMLSAAFIKPFYQISTCVVMVIFIVLYAFTQNSLMGVWLKNNQEADEGEIQQSLDVIKKGDLSKEKRVSILMFFILCFPLLIFGLIDQNHWILAGAVGVGLMTLNVPFRKRKKARKSLEKEIGKQFPIWLRRIALALQTDTVYVAMENSIETAPFILRQELRDTLKRIDRDPENIEPYLHFFEELDLPEIQSNFRMLYSLGNLGSDDSEEQINSIIKRNNALFDKAEREANEDEVAVKYIIVLIAMFLCTIKVMLDMVQVLGIFTGIWTKL
ncbi:MAG: hypothetical protein ACLSX0_01535 [Anaerostipes caccae]|mgnify:CR=1 FL=1